MNYVFSYDLIKANESTFCNLIRSLIDDGNTCFVLASFVHNPEVMTKYLADMSLFVQTFMCPFPSAEQAATAWKANTVKSINASLYIDCDQPAVEQSRLLGVPSAYYRR
jgi:hypothetical protein